MMQAMQVLLLKGRTFFISSHLNKIRAFFVGPADVARPDFIRWQNDIQQRR